MSSALDKMKSRLVVKAAHSGTASTGQPSVQERLRQAATTEKPATTAVERQEVLAPSPIRGTTQTSSSTPEPVVANTTKPRREPKTDRSVPLTVSMPSLDVARIQKIRKRAAKRGDIYPKSQIMRAALIYFDELDDAAMLEFLRKVASSMGNAED